MSELRRRHKPEARKANHERWLISYADMLTLLLAFFILLWSSAKVDQAKFKQAAAGMLTAFEGTPPMLIPAPSSPHGLGHSLPRLVPRPLVSTHAPAAPNTAVKPVLSDAEQRRLEPIVRAMAGLRQHLQLLLAPEIAKGRITISNLPLSVRIRLNASILFDSGQAALTKPALQVLGSLGDVLAKLPADYLITVQGYTDNQPIRSAVFSSNWDLSTARAVSVVRLFRDRHVPGEALSAQGFSKYRPIDGNTTSGGRAANRRVEILISAPKPAQGTAHAH